jgi:hypothetical protein
MINSRFIEYLTVSNIGLGAWPDYRYHNGWWSSQSNLGVDHLNINRYSSLCKHKRFAAFPQAPCVMALSSAAIRLRRAYQKNCHI